MSFVNYISGLTAAGTIVGTSLQLSTNGVQQVNQFYQVSTCTSTNSGVKLPVCDPGLSCTVRNDGAFACSVYPQTGGAINSLAVNASFSVPATGVQIFSCIDGLNWYTSTGGTASILPIVPIAGSVTAQTLTPSQSGSLISVAAVAANCILTLPTVQAGLNFDFILNAAATHTVTINCPGGALMTCQQVSSDAKSNTSSVGATNIIFAATAVKGDRVRLISDGTSWFGYAQSSVQTVITTS